MSLNGLAAAPSACTTTQFRGLQVCVCVCVCVGGARGGVRGGWGLCV